MNRRKREMSSKSNGIAVAKSEPRYMVTSPLPPYVFRLTHDEITRLTRNILNDNAFLDDHHSSDHLRYNPNLRCKECQKAEIYERANKSVDGVGIFDEDDPDYFCALCNITDARVERITSNSEEYEYTFTKKNDS